MADEVGRDLPSFSASVLDKTDYLCQNDVGDGTTRNATRAASEEGRLFSQAMELPEHKVKFNIDVSGCIL